MDGLPRITLSGDLEGDSVVLAKKANGSLRIAPEQQNEVPTVVALKQTTWACPTQWEGTLDDGRTLFAHCRRGELSVGVGDSVNHAIDNTAAEEALCFEYVADGPMSFEELRAHLYGLLEFPEGLVVEGERKSGLEVKEMLRKHPPDPEWAGELRELRESVGPVTDPDQKGGS
jgi:hypothetical protein